MKCHWKHIVLVLTVECLLFAVKSSGAISQDYSVSQLQNFFRQTFFPAGASHRRYVYGKSSSSVYVTSPAPAPFLGPLSPFSGPSPSPSPSLVPVPVPAPALFPVAGDPPFTIPFIAPTPGPLTIPIPDVPVAPNLSGNCSLNFTAVSANFLRTAFDCADPLAAYVGVVICCPQFDSLLRIMQGQHMLATGALALNDTEAEFCFNDTVNILVSQQGYNNVPVLCNVTPANLTVASCPVSTVEEFEEVVNTTALYGACRGVDPFRECNTQTCQNEIAAASLRLAQGLFRVEPTQETVQECESLALSWLASKLTPAQANTALRTVMSCSVNRACPLNFSDTSEVSRSCQGSSPSNVTCCKSLDDYLLIMQRQMLITNQQAYRCAALLSRRLQNEGVTTDLYSLCDVDLRDFSLQAIGTEGCLLPSQPTDVNATSGITFICDLNDNIAALWQKQVVANASSPAPVAVPPAGGVTTGSGSRTPSLLGALAISWLVFSW